MDNICDYLFHVNEEFNQYGEANEDEINEIVPLDIIKDDLNFYKFIVNSNNV